MPAFIAMIWGAFYNVLGSVVGRALVALGLGVITYSGVSATLDWLKGNFLRNASLLPPDVLGMLSTMKVGESVNIVFSALLVKLVLNGMKSDTMKRWITK